VLGVAEEGSGMVEEEDKRDVSESEIRERW